MGDPVAAGDAIAALRRYSLVTGLDTTERAAAIAI